MTKMTKEQIELVLRIARLSSLQSHLSAFRDKIEGHALAAHPSKAELKALKLTSQAALWLLDEQERCREKLGFPE